MRAAYWSTVTYQRLSRRRALAASGATAAGAAILAACGSSSRPSAHGGVSGDKSGLIAAVKDETKDVKRGGVWKSRSDRDPPSWEPHTVGSGNSAVPCYSALFLIKDGYMSPTSGEIGGDVVESWEVSSDKLTLTAKLSPDAHFAPLAPVNGRAVDARDVVFSWQRLKSIGSRRGEFANELNANAPISSITAPDDRTVVIKLAQPNATVTALLTYANAGGLAIAPKEAADPNVIDLRSKVIGSGPWYISDYKTGVGYTFKRNPGFKQDKRDLPYIDQIENPIILEYAAALAQFRTGSIYSFAARQDDVLPLKRDVPELQLNQLDLAPVASARTYFTLVGNSPFKDERLRQAWTMTYDRDLYIETMGNVSTFRAQGLPIDTVYECALQSDSWKGWVLDPQSKEFGANSRFFKYDIAEAKKLVTAAGFPNGVDTEVHYPLNGGDVPQAAVFFKAVDVLLGMVSDSKLFRWGAPVQHKFILDWLPNYQTHAQFPGVGILLSGFAYDPVTYMYSYYHSSGGLSQGTDSTMEELLNKAVKEYDDEKRKSLIWDAQRYEGGKLFFPRMGGAGGFQVSWPILRNQLVYRGGTGRGSQAGATGPAATLFLDPAYPPVKRS